jgi:hypothetical protein
MSKNLETNEPQMTSQYGAYALRVGLARLHARMHMHTPMRRAPTRTHAHRQICNTYCFSTATVIRERASLLRYTYIACLFFV